MNWSKGLTVKDKILLHLLKYTQYSESDYVPEKLTQQGIADTINAPRPHVSIALKDLRSQDLLIERICHIEQGKRKQKVYFLTHGGTRSTNVMEQRLMTAEITVKTSTGETKQRVSDLLAQKKFSIFDILDNVTPEGVLDITQPIPKPEPGTIPRSEQDLQDPKVPPVAQPLEPHGQQPPFEHARSQIGGDYRSPAQQRVSKYDYQYAHGDYGYDDYRYYHYHEISAHPPSVRANRIMFFIGYLLMLVGFTSGIILFADGEQLLIIPMVLFLTFGTTLMALAATILWSHRNWQKNILNLLSSTMTIALYLMVYSAVSPDIPLSDVGIWVIILISFFAFAYFGTFIPLTSRIRSLSAFGLVILIITPQIFLLSALDVFQAGFWALIGLLCIFISFTLSTDESMFSEIRVGIILGTGLGILLASIVFLALSDFNDLAGIEYSIFAITALWLITAIILIHTGLEKQGVKAEQLAGELKLAVPIFFGMFLIFFGAFLIQFGKVMETLIEFLLGAMLILYGIQCMKAQKPANTMLIILIICSLAFTLGYILTF